MKKVTIEYIKEETFKRSTLISIPALEDLLTLNERYTAAQVFFSIVNLAVQEYSRYLPLRLDQKLYVEPDINGKFEFEDNFETFIKGQVEESGIALIPNAVLGFNTSSYTNYSQLIRQFNYTHPPFMTDFPYARGVYYFRTLCNYPIYEEYIEESNCTKYTDHCAVYFITNRGSHWKIFFDEVYLQLCRYLINLRKNMDMPNLPITLFQGLEEDYSRMESNQQSIYMQSAGDGSWYI